MLGTSWGAGVLSLRTVTAIIIVPQSGSRPDPRRCGFGAACLRVYGTAPPVFVISLADAKARRAGIAENLASLDLAFEFVDAVDGRQGMPALRPGERLFADPKDTVAQFGRRFSPMEVACYLSHLRLMSRFAASGVDAALVMEDDMRAGAELPALLAELLALPLRWELIRLHQLLFSAGRRVVLPLLGGRCVLARPRGGIEGTGAYLVNRSGARSMSAWLGNIRVPIDHALDRFWESGARQYSVLPNPVWRAESCASVIHRVRPAPARLPFALRCRAGFWLRLRRLRKTGYVLRRCREFF